MSFCSTVRFVLCKSYPFLVLCVTRVTNRCRVIQTRKWLKRTLNFMEHYKTCAKFRGKLLFSKTTCSQPMINGKDKKKKKKKKKDIIILSKSHLFNSHFMSPFLQTLFQNAYSANPKGDKYTIFYLSWFNCRFAASKKGLPRNCAHVLYSCNNKISILFNRLCVWILF